MSQASENSILVVNQDKRAVSEAAFKKQILDMFLSSAIEGRRRDRKKGGGKKEKERKPKRQELKREKRQERKNDKKNTHAEKKARALDNKLSKEWDTQLRPQKKKVNRRSKAMTAAKRRALKEDRWAEGAGEATEKASKQINESGSWWDSALETAGSIAKVLGPVLMGMGDYEEDTALAVADPPASNSLLAACTGGEEGGLAPQMPYMHSRGNVTRISRREYIGDVYSTTSAFSAIEFPLNPGLETTFSWLAPIAAQFTSYRMKGMTAEFVSEGSETANVAGLGYVALATKYNVLQGQYTDKRTMLNSQFADAQKPSASFIHWIECNPAEVAIDGLFVRSAANPTGSDLRLYDMGTLVLAVGGNTAPGSVIGELWFSYDVDLFFPKVDGPGGGILQYAAFSTTGVSNTALFGTIQSPSVRNTIVPTFSTDGTTMKFPSGLRGTYFLELIWAPAATVAAPVLPSITGTNVIASQGQAGGFNTGTQYMFDQIQLVFTQDGGQLQLTAGAVTNGGTLGSVTFYQVPGNPPSDPEFFDRKGVHYLERYEKQLDFFRKESSTPDDAFSTLLASKSYVVKECDTDSNRLRIYTVEDKRLLFDGVCPAIHELEDGASDRMIDLVINNFLRMNKKKDD